jgi:peptidoglycan/xylan/chitin deacetylase (PgdA/CDA1 family)
VIVEGLSILDPALDRIHIQLVREHLRSREWDLTRIQYSTLSLPTRAHGVLCALYGPAMGDPPVPEAAVRYDRRPGYEFTSRLVPREPVHSWQWPVRLTWQITVRVGPQEGAHGRVVLLHAFPGPFAPYEQNDPRLPQADTVESIAFWCTHALTTVPAR